MIRKLLAHLVILSILFLIFTETVLSQEPYRMTKVKNMASYMTFSETVWQNIPRGVDFFGARSKWQDLSTRQTRFKGVYDDENLCFQMEMLFPAESAPTYTPNLKRDAGDVFSGEDLELFLITSGKNGASFQFCVSPNGTLFDSRNKDAKWNAKGIQVITLIDKKRWLAIIKIPFKDLLQPPMKLGEKWRFNVCRTWIDDNLRSRPTSWMKLAKNGYHSPELFASLIFAKSTPTGPISVSQKDNQLLLNSNLDNHEKSKSEPRFWRIPTSSKAVYAEKTKYNPDFAVTGNKEGVFLSQTINRQVSSIPKFTFRMEASGNGTAKLQIAINFLLSSGCEIRKTIIETPQPRKQLVTRKIERPEDAVVLKNIQISQINTGSVCIDSIGLTPQMNKPELRPGKLSPMPTMVGAPLVFPDNFPWRAPGAEPFRILFIADSNNVVIEHILKAFSEQFDWTYDILRGNAARNPDEIRKRLKENLYQAVFTQGITLSKIPKSIRTAVEETGMGLVMLLSRRAKTPGMKKIYTRGKPYKKLPPLDGLPLEQMSPTGIPELKMFGIHAIYQGTMGKGRVVAIECADRQFYRHGILPAIDETWLAEQGTYIEEWLGFDWWNYYHSLYGKCILWSARISSPFQIEQPAKNIIRKPGDNISIAISNTICGKQSTYYIDATLFRDETKEKTYPPKKISLPLEKKYITTFLLPETLIGGRHFLNYRLLNDKKKVLSWGTRCFIIRPKDLVFINKLTTPNRQLVPGDKLTVKIDLSRKPTSKHIFNIMIFDAFQRLLTTKTLFLSKATTIINLQPEKEQILTTYAHIVLDIIKDGKTTDRATTDIFFAIDQNNLFRDYVFAAYAWIATPYRPLAFRLFREIGINTINCFPQGSYSAAKSGFPWLDGWGGVIKNKGVIYPPLQERKSKINNPADKHKQDGCLSDPKWETSLKNAVDRYCDVIKRNPPMGYFLLDEMTLAAPWHGHALSEPDRHPMTLEAYRGHLQQKYKTIDLLNKQWDTHYKFFSNITPPMTKESRKKANLSSWVDFRVFMDDIMTSAGKRFHKYVHENNKTIRSGQPNFCYEGPFTGIDPVKLAISRNGAQSYGMDDFNRCFKKPGTTIWNWSCYKYPEFPQLRGKLWRRLFRGASGATIFGTWFTGKDKPVGFLHPNFGLTKRAIRLKNATSDLVNGTGRLIINTPRKTPQFAILFSQPSMHMSWLESEDPISFSWNIRKRKDVDAYMSYFRSRDAFKKLLRNSLWQFDFVTEKQVSTGKLASYKALILPMCIGLSESCRKSILNWQKQGGIVVADLRAGARDEHGKVINDDWTKQVFGIRRLSRPKYKSRMLNIDANKIDVPEGAEIEVLSPAKAETHFHSNTQAIVINKQGNGLGIYLNFVARYSDNLAEYLSDLLKKHGIERAFRIVENSTIKPEDSFWSKIFSLGDKQNHQEAKEIMEYELIPFRQSKEPVTYIGIIGSLNIDKTTNKPILLLPEKKLVYDMIGKNCLGWTTKIPLQIDPGDIALFALCDESSKLEKISIPSHIKQGNCLKAQVTITPYVKRVLRLTVIGPDGHDIAELGKNVDANKGTWKGNIPIALNMKAGKYQLKIRDVMSNFTITHSFIVEEALRK